MKTLSKDGMTVKVITDAKEARQFVGKLKAGKNGKHYAIDFETTGLDPRSSQVRLSCISRKPNEAYVIDHFKCGSFASFADDLADCGPWYVFNSCFEGSWFDYEAREAVPVVLHDVGHMRRAVRGGGPLNLKTQIKWDLGIEIAKDLQQSDWSADQLSASQYFYGGTDAIHTRALGRMWDKELTDEQRVGFHVINDTWRAVNECSTTGMLVDVEYHKTLISMWKKREAAAERAIRRLVPSSQLANLQSPKQVSDFLKSVLDDHSIDAWPKTEKTHQLQTSRAILRGMAHSAPYPFSRFLAGMMVLTRAKKYLSTYGESLLTKQALSSDGRVHGRLNMAQAITGRFSSSGPNLQNFPNSPVVRRSFIAGPGKKMILADYSGVEVRVLAELSGDKILLHDAIYDDVHAQSAIAIYGLDEDDFKAKLKAKDPRAKAMRGKAKGFTFQLLYGAGAAALALVLRCSVEEAEAAVAAWASRYRRAYHYRTIVFERMMSDGIIECASGRTIFVPKRDRSMPVAANYPCQGSAGDVMYCAMQETEARLDARDVDASMMVSVHDELLLLADDDPDECERAAKALNDGMIAGWLRIFPDTNTDNLIDVAIGGDWSDKA